MKNNYNFETLRYLEGGKKANPKSNRMIGRRRCPNTPLYHNFQSTFYMLNNYVISRMVSYSNSCLTEILI